MKISQVLMGLVNSIFLLFMVPCQLSARVDHIRESNMPFESRQHITGSLEERYLVSSETNSPFTQFVYLPPSYTDTQRKYPLMIINDASLINCSIVTSLAGPHFSGTISRLQEGFQKVTH